MSSRKLAALEVPEQRKVWPTQMAPTPQSLVLRQDAELVASRLHRSINELKNVADSTLSAIMGRMSAYTGKEVTWKMALESKEDLMPEKLDWDMKLETPAVAIPGTTPFR